MTAQELRSKILALKKTGVSMYVFERHCGLYKGAISNFMSDNSNRNGLSEENKSKIINGLQDIKKIIEK